ncbi:MAG: 6-phosphogluconolactonase [Patescibacteria group bacterium]
MINTVTRKTEKEALKTAIAELNEVLHRHNSHQVLLLCSGGSALTLVDGIDPDYLTDQITVSMLDERYSKDPDENNFAQMKELAFYDHIEQAGCPIIDTQVKENETLDGLADRFDQSLHNWVTENPGGIVIATMGIGNDGHISGVMPYPESEELFNSQFVHTDRYAVGYDASHKNPYPYRVTTTISFLIEHITEAIVYIGDEGKQSIVRQIVNAEKPAHQLPGMILHSLARVSLITAFPLDQ